MLAIKLGFDWPAVSEKIFEYFCNIHVYCPGVGADQPMGSKSFSELPTFSPFAHFLQDLPFNDILTIFPIQMHGRPMLTLP